jgi:hypothetical protein
MARCRKELQPDRAGGICRWAACHPRGGIRRQRPSDWNLGQQLARQALEQGARDLLPAEKSGVSLLSGKRVLVTRPQQVNDNLQRAAGGPGRAPGALSDSRDCTGCGWLGAPGSRSPTPERLCLAGVYQPEGGGPVLRALEGGPGGGPLPAIAAIGPATARALAENGLPVTAMPEEYTGDAIPAVMGDVREEDPGAARPGCARGAHQRTGAKGRPGRGNCAVQGGYQLLPSRRPGWSWAKAWIM